MAATPSRGNPGTASRFVVAGIANTAVTAALLSLLSLWIDPRIAYTFVFALGIALSTVLAGNFVFRTRLTPRRTAAYIAVYIAVYLIGLGATAAFISAGLPAWTAGMVVLITAPLSFLGGSLVFRDRSKPELPPGQ